MGVGTKSKPKRRNSEKRKEKSRDAARTRRSKETEIFCQLAHELPVNYNLLSQLDKASIIRLIITHLKLRGIFQHAVVDTTATTFPTSLDLERRLDQLYYKALDGFLMVVTSNGDLIYISDNVVSHLGVTQIDMLGQSIFEFVHPCDHDEIRDVCCSKQHSVDGNRERDFFVRMKSTLTSKGRSINIKSASYRVVHCSGHLMSSDRSLEPLDLTKNEPVDESFFILNGRPIPHPSNVEIPLDNQTFVSRHSMDMKFVYCDEGISKMLGFKPEELIGKSLYEFHHALDGDSLEKAYKTLFTKGQSVTGLYRFLAKDGGYAWIETQATVIKNPRTEKAQFVVCINSVVSGIQEENELLCTIQQPDDFMVLKQEEDAIIDKEDELIEDETPATDETDECEELDDDDDQIQFVTEKFLQNLGARALNSTNIFGDDAVPRTSASVNGIQSIIVQPDNNKERRELAIDTMTPVSSSESLYKMLGDFHEQDDVYEMRAPFISMDDMFFSPQSTTQENNSIVSCTMDTNAQMLVVSDQLNSDVITTFYTVASSCEEPEAAGQGIIKFKRPIEVIGLPAASALGLGTIPPAAKVARYLSEDQVVSSTVHERARPLVENIQSYQQQQHQSKPVRQIEPVNIGGSSVLRNLLLNGEDVNFGYRLNGGVPADQSTPSNQQGASCGKVVPFASTLYKLLCSQNGVIVPADNLLRMQNDSIFRLCMQQKATDFGH